MNEEVGQGSVEDSGQVIGPREAHKDEDEAQESHAGEKEMVAAGHAL